MKYAASLKWRNRNIALEIDGTNIYRSESPMDKDNLPPPYDFVEGTDSMYVDYDVEVYKKYYYRIGVVRGDEELITEEEVELFGGGQELLAPTDIESEYIEDEE